MTDLTSNTSSPVIRLAARGDGVTADGRFVPGAIPGDEVRPDGAIIPLARRQDPPCSHFGDCGGCQLQHLPDDMLAQFVVQRITEPLARANIPVGEVQPVHMSPPHSRRRAAMRATRTRGEVRLGFNAMGEHRIVDLQQCPVLHPDLVKLLPSLRALLGPHLREASAISVTLTLTDNGVDLLLGNLQAPEVPEIHGLVEFAAQHQLARLSITGAGGIETLVTHAPPQVRFGDVPVVLPPAAFLQATSDGEQALVQAVREIVGSSRRVLDLFSGCGTFSFPLSGASRVTATEGAKPAISALATAASRAGRKVQTEHRDLFRNPLQPVELNKFDAVVIDPPRAGAKEQFACLAQSKVPVIAAVSCNPATFSRDAALLQAGGYSLKRLWPVAQFRWSTHVELVAEFTRHQLAR